MKNLVMLIALISCTLAPAAFAKEDTSVTLEFIWGIGGTTSHKGFALRAGRDNAEVHVAHWFGARSNTVLGVGVTARSEGDGQAANRGVHASGTVGLAYAFQTNSVLSNHFQPYVRVAGGFDLNLDGDVELEFSYSRYGFKYAEDFGGVGLRFNDRYTAPKSKGTSSRKPEDDDPDDDDDDSDDDNDDDSDDDNDDDSDDDNDNDSDDDDGNNGHGDDDDGCDESNPAGCNGGGDDDDGNSGGGNDDDDDGNNGHGDDDDGDDDSNPGNGDGHDDDDDDSDSDDDDGNNGHGNDDDGCDNSNPGNGGDCS